MAQGAEVAPTQRAQGHALRARLERLAERVGIGARIRQLLGTRISKRFGARISERLGTRISEWLGT